MVGFGTADRPPPPSWLHRSSQSAADAGQLFDPRQKKVMQADYPDCPQQAPTNRRSSGGGQHENSRPAAQSGRRIPMAGSTGSALREFSQRRRGAPVRCQTGSPLARATQTARLVCATQGGLSHGNALGCAAQRTSVTSACGRVLWGRVRREHREDRSAVLVRTAPPTTGPQTDS